MPLPELSPEQRAAALEKAAAARKARAELREKLKSKGTTVGVRAVTGALTCSDVPITAPHGPPRGVCSTPVSPKGHRVPGDQPVRSD